MYFTPSRGEKESSTFTIVSLLCLMLCFLSLSLPFLLTVLNVMHKTTTVPSWPEKERWREWTIERGDGRTFVHLSVFSFDCALELYHSHFFSLCLFSDSPLSDVVRHIETSVMHNTPHRPPNLSFYCFPLEVQIVLPLLSVWSWRIHTHTHTHYVNTITALARKLLFVDFVQTIFFL